MIKGQITLQVRDKNTSELISEITRENIITENFYARLAASWQTHCWIAITNANLEPSRFTQFLPINGQSGVESIVPHTRIPSINNWVEYFPKSESSPDIMQVSGRYNAPNIGQTRTISTVALVNYFDATQYKGVNDNPDSFYFSNYPYPHKVMAFSKLSEPCIQTDSQVIDVYYRVLFINDQDSDIPGDVFSEIIRRYASSNTGYYPRSVISPFPIPSIKDYDIGKIAFSKKSFAHSYSNIGIKANIFSPSTISYDDRSINSTNTNFTDWTGALFKSMISANEMVPYNYTNFEGFEKVQNIIGQGQEKTVATESNWLNVDNLPSGNGKFSISGEWQNKETPNSPGLYYSAKLPVYVKVNITETGDIGTSKYNFTRQKTLGTYEGGTGVSSNKNLYTPHTIHPLCTEETYYISSTNNQPTSFSNKTIFGESNDSIFNGIHMSICQRYDDSSFIIAKANEILLYNLAAGDYWRFTSTFTNIRQIAVANDKIYVGCKDTGLYVIDPKNSLVVVKISDINGIDFSACHGVAVGFNSKIWVVTANCLACLDNGVWSKYDESSNHPFQMDGISNQLWNNIEYLIVDKDSSSDNMLLVRKYDASQDANLLGVWWSTSTAAVNTGAEPQSSAAQLGRPRIIRNHIGVSDNFWVILCQNLYRIMQFGQDTFTATTINAISTSDGYGQRCQDTFQSIIFRKNKNGSPVQVALNGVEFTNQSNFAYNTNTAYYFLKQYVKLIGTGGNIDQSLTTNTGLIFPPEFFSTFKNSDYTDWSANSPYTIEPSFSRIRTTAYGSYLGNKDQSSYFELCPGLIISIFRDERLGPSSPGFTGVVFHAFMYGLDNTPDGGPLKWLAQDSYGWNGNSWEKDNIGSKATHTAQQELFDGLSISFQDGTNFVSPNVYKFGLCDGLLKDNATKFTLNSTIFYSRNLVKSQSELTASSVPALTQLDTGNVTYNPFRSSNGVYADELGQITFPGRNDRQYAIGDKEVTGDFIISYDVTNINTNSIKLASTFGICRHEFANYGQVTFGFVFNASTLAWIDNGQTSNITSDLASTTSLEIRRTGNTISLYRNNVLVKTMSSGVIRNSDQRLSLIFGTYDQRNAQYLLADGTKCPAATITQNGSDRSIYFGNSIQKTGAFHSRFCGIDASLPITTQIFLDSQPATVKLDGTYPNAGEVSIDALKGIMYFNELDEGKTVSAEYSYKVS